VLHTLIYTKEMMDRIKSSLEINDIDEG
jgi:hypothetical protein